MYQFGKVGNTNIDYQNANSPPTYFRKLLLYFAFERDVVNSQGAFA
jgi:hypothetical protein